MKFAFTSSLAAYSLNNLNSYHLIRILLMKKITSVTITLLLSLFCFHIAHAAVVPAPANIAISRGSQKTVTFTYKISNTNPGDNHILAASTTGVFKSGGTSLGVINNTVSATLSDPGTGLFSGKVAETVIISAGVLKRAEKLKTNTFVFERTFTLTGGAVPSYSLTAVSTINVKSAGSADFSIQRLRLYFVNNRGEITVKRNQESLKAYAHISFDGTGLLQGYWQVDDRLISHVNRHLSPGKSVTLETPDSPALPTMSTGTHVVKFVFTRPEQDLVLPKAIYYVTPDEAEKLGTVALITPKNSSVVGASNAVFRWKNQKGAEAFLIEFIDDDASRPVFSAFLEKPEYVLPAAVLKYYFSNKKTYFWSVKAFDSESNVTAKSLMGEFRLK